MNSSLKLMIAAVVAAGTAGGVALAQTTAPLSTDPSTGSYASGSLNNDSAIQHSDKSPASTSMNSSSTDSSMNSTRSDASSSIVNANDAATDSTLRDHATMTPRADRN